MLPPSDAPTVTISQARNLTDQDVQITWKNFTPTLSSTATAFTPNPSTADGVNFPVSIFECNGTNPDFSNATAVSADCYTIPLGEPETAWTGGPPNGQMGFTLDGDAPPASAVTNQTSNVLTVPYSAEAGYTAVKKALGSKLPQLPIGSPFCSDPSQPCTYNGGDPSTWSGQADFHIEAPTARTKRGFFNCSSSTPCSLVVDPVWGGTSARGTESGNKLVSYNDPSQCGDHTLGQLDSATGDLLPGGASAPGDAQTAFPVQTPPSLIGESGSCWAADRIVIPLSFAPTNSVCPATTPQFDAQGAPMMQLQMTQWQTGLCTGSGALSVQYTSTPESVARDAFLVPPQVGGSPTDMALVTLPVDASAQQASSRKFTYAPLANSGTGVAFELDDAGTGAQINRMVLNPELLAKLTTQSYSLVYGGCSRPAQPSLTCDPAVQKNPETLFDDPEFLSLNQDCQPVGAPYAQALPYTCGTHTPQNSPPSDLDEVSSYSDYPSDTANDLVGKGAFMPTVLQPEDDMTYALTDMIAHDPQAEGFLNGKTDSWDMHVNNDYVGVSYPVQNFTVKDNGFTDPSVKECGNDGRCDGGLNNTTTGVSWNFQTDLNTIAQDLLNDQPSAEDTAPECPSAIATLGNGCTNVTELTYPARPGQLQGQRALLSVLDLGDIANYDFPAASIVNASGTAVAPSQASVEAAVKDMKTNPDGVTQYFDYSTTDKAAYPLSMVDYAMVPTCGLSKSTASDIAEFLTRAATTGQVQGEAPGQLGPGYYPLTAVQKAKTLAAAAEVKAQDCKSTPLDRTIDGQKAVDDVQSPGHAPNGTSPAGKKHGTGPGQSGPGAGAPTVKAQNAAFGQKSPDSGLTGLLLLLAIIAGSVASVGGPAAWAVTVTGKWPVVARYTRPAWAWVRPAWTRVRAIRIRRP
jgi:hypothetical protein